MQIVVKVAKVLLRLRAIPHNAKVAVRLLLRARLARAQLHVRHQVLVATEVQVRLPSQNVCQPPACGGRALRLLIPPRMKVLEKYRTPGIQCSLRETGPDEMSTTLLNILQNSHWRQWRTGGHSGPSASLEVIGALHTPRARRRSRPGVDVVRGVGPVPALSPSLQTGAEGLVTARQTGRLELPCNTKICKRCAAVSRRRQAQLGSTYRPKKKGVCSITGLPHRASCTAKPVMPIMAARPFLISASCMSLVGKYSVYLLSGSKP